MQGTQDRKSPLKNEQSRWEATDHFSDRAWRPGLKPRQEQEGIQRVSRLIKGKNVFLLQGKDIEFYSYCVQIRAGIVYYRLNFPPLTFKYRCHLWEILGYKTRNNYCEVRYIKEVPRKRWVWALKHLTWASILWGKNCMTQFPQVGSNYTSKVHHDENKGKYHWIWLSARVPWGCEPYENICVSVQSHIFLGKEPVAFIVI